jgi:hypothetical protein
MLGTARIRAIRSHVGHVPSQTDRVVVVVDAHGTGRVADRACEVGPRDVPQWRLVQLGCVGAGTRPQPRWLGSPGGLLVRR